MDVGPERPPPVKRPLDQFVSRQGKHVVALTERVALSALTGVRRVCAALRLYALDLLEPDVCQRHASLSVGLPRALHTQSKYHTAFQIAGRRKRRQNRNVTNPKRYIANSLFHTHVGGLSAAASPLLRVPVYLYSISIPAFTNPHFS